MRHLAYFLALSFTSVAFAGSAHADPVLSSGESAPPPATAPDDRPEHDVSITFSPLHLFLPMVEVTGEYAISNKIGVAGIVGIGSVPVKTTTFSSSTNGGLATTETTTHYGAWELGAHFNYYLVGNFDHGMQLGAEAMYLHVSSEGQNVNTVAAASGLAIGPYIGYKIATHVGFTFEANGGVQYVAARASATNGTASSSASGSSIIPLLNLNVGWSF